MVIQMQPFDYKAVESSGKAVAGTIMANSAKHARRKLKQQSLTIISVKNAAKSKTKTPSHKTSPKSGSKIKNKDLSRATRQLAVLVGSGSPVAEAINLTANQFGDTAMRKALLDIRTKILEGQTLSRAMKSNAGFPKLYSALIAAGEESGNLDIVLERLADYLEKTQSIRRKVIGAVIYPILLLVFAILVIALLMVVVVPKVVEQFNSLGQDLPFLTKMIINISDFFKDWGIALILSIIIVIFIFWRALKIDMVRLWVDKFILKIPLIGALNRDVNIARFCRTMSGLIDSGTPAISAMKSAQNVLNNMVLRKSLDNVIEQVRGGESLAASFKRTGEFSPLMTQMISGGEQSGELARMFAITASYMEEEFDNSINIVLNLLAPVIIIGLGVMVLLIVMAIFLPILQLNTLVY